MMALQMDTKLAIRLECWKDVEMDMSWGGLLGILRVGQKEDDLERWWGKQ